MTHEFIETDAVTVREEYDPRDIPQEAVEELGIPVGTELTTEKRHGAGTDTPVNVFTTEKGVMNRLLYHDAFTLSEAVTDHDNVYALVGTIPFDYCKIQSTGREHGSRSDLVSRKVLRGDPK